MDPNFSVTKFITKDKTLYAKLFWKPSPEDLFHIQIFDGNVCQWSGKFSNQSAQKFCDRNQETENEYIRHVKRYLQESARKDVTYDFVVSREDNELATFTWKKSFEDVQGPIFLVHGSVLVHLDKSVESKDIILDLLFEENRILRTTIENLNGQNDAITMELKTCRTELGKFVDIKTELEASLYGKFVQLLNAKKRRIQVLEGSVQKVSAVNDLDGDH